jgi:hypothetical protein
MDVPCRNICINVPLSDRRKVKDHARDYVTSLLRCEKGEKLKDKLWQGEHSFRLDLHSYHHKHLDIQPEQL